MGMLKRAYKQQGCTGLYVAACLNFTLQEAEWSSVRTGPHFMEDLG